MTPELKEEIGSRMSLGSYYMLQGLRAEHLVCADLISRGFLVVFAPAGSKYDLIVDVNGVLLKVQVKGVSAPYVRPRKDASATDHYQYRFKMFGQRGAHQIPTSYKSGDFDLLALVTLDNSNIGYMTFGQALERGRYILIHQEHYVSPKPEITIRRLSDYSFEKALKAYMQAA
jgi:hypothetical protein